jgi:hypothetical protein
MERREFVKRPLAVGMATILPQSAFGANERVVLGVMGGRGRGRGLAEGFASLPQARVKPVRTSTSKNPPRTIFVKGDV